jgi:hypothetical protein
MLNLNASCVPVTAFVNMVLISGLHNCRRSYGPTVRLLASQEMLTAMELIVSASVGKADFAVKVSVSEKECYRPVRDSFDSFRTLPHSFPPVSEFQFWFS